MFIKLFIVLCLGHLIAQGNAQRPDPGEDFDYVIQLLEDLEKQISNEVRSITESLRTALKRIEDLSSNMINDLTKELSDAIIPMLEKIAAVEREASELDVDISNCLNGSVDSINDLPKELLAVSAACLNTEYLDAEKVTNEAMKKLNDYVSAIDNYWTQIEECAEKTSTQREICIKQLETEISRDFNDIPGEMALISEEALGYLNTLKTEILYCTAHRMDYLEEIGGAIVINVSACAENIFNPTTTSQSTTAAPTTTTSAPTTTKIPTTVPSTTTAAPTTTENPTTVSSSTTDVPTTTERPTTVAPTTTAAPTSTERPTTVPSTTTAVPTTTKNPTTASPTTTAAPTTREIPTTASS